MHFTWAFSIFFICMLNLPWFRCVVFYPWIGRYQELIVTWCCTDHDKWKMGCWKTRVYTSCTTTIGKLLLHLFNTLYDTIYYLYERYHQAYLRLLIAILQHFNRMFLLMVKSLFMFSFPHCILIHLSLQIVITSTVRSLQLEEIIGETYVESGLQFKTIAKNIFVNTNLL